MHNQKRVCDLIINNGSRENIASESLATKLGLKTKRHLNPYKIGWIRKVTNVKVTDICRVTFFIRKNYADEVLCDVVKMDACHLIIGRL